ncbi:MAG TPA: FkbM family methyltransferase [Thiobacillus sp.]
MNQIEHSGSWGRLSPSSVGRALLFFKKMGFARGVMKKFMAHLWSGFELRTPVDIRYAGLKFRVYPWDNTVEYKMLFGSKPRDWAEIKLLQSYAGKDGVFLDIGANIGYYALMAVHHGAGTVLAFEPNPKVFARLKFNIEANDLSNTITALPFALGDKVDTVTMTVSESDMGGSHISHLSGLAGTSIEVEMKPLAEVISSQGISQVDALKIDVEGMEDAVLFPFFETSPRSLWPRLVIIEHTSQTAWKKDILSWMMASGYQEIERNRSNAMLCLSKQ